MPTGPAARITDPVIDPAPVLTPGPGSPNVMIGALPAWRGILAAAAGGLYAAKATSGAAITAAEAATAAAGWNSRSLGITMDLLKRLQITYFR